MNTTNKYLLKILIATPKLEHLEEVKVQETLKFKMVSHRDIQSFAETLEELKFNSKAHISNLTELANHFGKKRQGREVIKIIKKRILSKETPITHKMPTLYLLDSILKNHPNNYKQHIEEILASVFEAIFSSSDKKIAMAMYKLRQTWTPWFQHKTLYDLDVRAKNLDKAWPIIGTPSKSVSGSDLLKTLILDIIFDLNTAN